MQNRLIGVIALSLLALSPLGCESDYTLGQETPAGLGTATPGDTGEETPPVFEPTPSATEPTPEGGYFEALLRVEPETLDYGQQFRGCSRQSTLKVYNDGTVPVQITNVYLSGAPVTFAVDLSDDLQTLDPGQQGHIWVDVDFVTLGLEDLQIRVDATEGAAARVPLKGEVIENVKEVTETFYQLAQNAVDVLWIIDTSGSMSNNQKRLSQNFESFMHYFAPLDINYNLGLITADIGQAALAGELQGKYDLNGEEVHFVNVSMKEDAIDDFTGQVVKVGQTGGGGEAGLRAMELALTEPLVSNHNKGFLREEAFLSVIIVSDEEDQSPPDAVTGEYEAHYIGFLEALKGSREQVVVNAIVSFTQPFGYAKVATDTGGVVYPINGDYAEILLEIGWASAGYKSSFQLESVPATGQPISVLVNGSEWPEGPSTWAYDAPSHSIVFASETVPGDGARIDVIYSAPVSCDEGEQ